MGDWGWKCGFCLCLGLDDEDACAAYLCMELGWDTPLIYFHFEIESESIGYASHLIISDSLGI